MDALLTTRLICIVLWGAVLCTLFPSFIRYVQGSFDNCDEARSIILGAAFVFCATYAGRLFAEGDDEGVLVAVNVFSAVLAVLALVVAYQGRVK